MDDKLSLTELQFTIRDALYTSLPGVFWVSAEISELKENYSGHCYLELIDKVAGDENIKARAKAIIWANRYRMLKPFFENATGEPMREGLRVLIKVTLEYHEIYGLSLVITDIDPAYTIGEMAIRRFQIIRRLEEEGVLEMNKEHFFPLVPKRIAIVSSRNAAGYTDFIKQLHANINGYVFHTALFEAVMQGSETSESVIRALDLISEKVEFFDVVVIIRGGGSQTDLGWFDNYNIAFHITQFPLPIVTGIGHEKDMTVVDIVANTSVKTPTAVADLLINRTLETESHLIDLGNDIAVSSAEIIDHHRAIIETYSRKLIPMATMIVSEIKETISSIKINLLSFGKDYLNHALNIPGSLTSRLKYFTKTAIRTNELFLTRTILEVTSMTKINIKQKNDSILEKSLILKIIDPVNVLKRGFTITSLNGRILKNIDSVNSNDSIETHFNNGVLKSKVLDKKLNKLT